MNTMGRDCHKRTPPLSGFRNGEKKFEVPVGLRVETDYAGNVRKIADPAPALHIAPYAIILLICG